MRKRTVIQGLLLAALVTPILSIAADDVEDVIRKSLSRAIPSSKITEIQPAPFKGFHEARVGMSILYVSDDGKYVMRGNLFDLESRTDLTESRLIKIRKDMIDQVDEDSMIIFPAKEEKYVVTVFTDINCGYCRKLHSEIADYNKEGITVRYMSFPRSGPGSDGYLKAISVWCSDDRNAALTSAKSGVNPGNNKCDNPVQDHLDLGIALGVNGTPAIVLENGTILPGYVPPKKLKEQLAKSRKG